MNLLDSALSLASQGFHVFPLKPNSKKPPLIDDFPERATRDPKQIKEWQKEFPRANWGVSTSKFGDDEALTGVDVDNKGKKRGSEQILRLELEGKEFPKTYTQTTPTGGLHLVYRCKEAVKQGVDVLGKGLDIRSRGGYLVGAGSIVGGKLYSADKNQVMPCPSWLLQTCGKAPEKQETKIDLPPDFDESRAIQRAVFYLENEAPISIKGNGGDHTAYKVAARVKDFGVTPKTCLDLMLLHWNERCPPGWSVDRLWEKVQHAYSYGNEPVGVSAPELQFKNVSDDDVKKALHPFDKINEHFALVISGGASHIIAEKTDWQGKFIVEHWKEEAFHKWHSEQTITLGNGKTVPLTRSWMVSPRRRKYRGLCFKPEQKVDHDLYNLWRGFSVKPVEKGEKPTLEMEKTLETFLNHMDVNVCQGDQKAKIWLTSYFAHMVQKPWENPEVAIVFQGAKGVGKNTLVECVGDLFTDHFMVAGNSRYLLSNFNSYLEKTLFFVLDEAFWSGSKEAEGILKTLITGKKHVIEHKGKEPFQVDNVTRVAILGNEEWVVPASADERRFAVFGVGEEQKQNRKYFKTIKEGMKNGGNRLLLRYLLDYDITHIDVGDPPKTKALLSQKLSSLDPFHKFWFQCLCEGRIVYSDFNEGWELIFEKERLRSAFSRYLKENQIHWRVPDIGRLFRKCLPCLDTKARKKTGKDTAHAYKVPDLDVARELWENFIGHEVDWD